MFLRVVLLICCAAPVLSAQPFDLRTIEPKELYSLGLTYARAATRTRLNRCPGSAREYINTVAYFFAYYQVVTAGGRTQLRQGFADSLKTEYQKAARMASTCLERAQYAFRDDGTSRQVNDPVEERISPPDAAPELPPPPAATDAEGRSIADLLQIIRGLERAIQDRDVALANVRQDLSNRIAALSRVVADDAAGEFEGPYRCFLRPRQGGRLALSDNGLHVDNANAAWFNIFPGAGGLRAVQFARNGLFLTRGGTGTLAGVDTATARRMGEAALEFAFFGNAAEGFRIKHQQADQFLWEEGGVVRLVSVPDDPRGPIGGRDPRGLFFLDC